MFHWIIYNIQFHVLKGLWDNSQVETDVPILFFISGVIDNSDKTFKVNLHTKLLKLLNKLPRH